MTHFTISKYADLDFCGILPSSFNTSLLELMQIRAATIGHYFIQVWSLCTFGISCIPQKPLHRPWEHAVNGDWLGWCGINRSIPYIFPWGHLRDYLKPSPNSWYTWNYIIQSGSWEILFTLFSKIKAFIPWFKKIIRPVSGSLDAKRINLKESLMYTVAFGLKQAVKQQKI